MVKKKKDEKSEVEILFPELEVEGVKIKPWSLGTLASLSPEIEKIITKLESAGITLDKLTLSSIMKVYLAIAPYAAAIISKTASIPIEEVNNYDMRKAILILRAIWEQNQDSLKNALALFGLEDTDMDLPAEEETK